MKKVFILLLIILVPTLITAQSTISAKIPQKRVADSELEAKIDSIFGWINDGAAPGCAVTVIQNDRVIAKKVYGMASLEQSVPFSHQTVVRIPYSEGREFISIAAMLMEQDGLLTLDSPVRDHFPDLPQWSRSVTVWDLLNHRSGFVDEWSELLLTQNSMANRFEPSQFLKLLYDQRVPSVEPGKGYMYSNSDFGLLRMILEKASGENLAVWMKKRIFEPLKMDSTRMQGNVLDVVPGRATTYAAAGESKFSIDVPQKTSPGGNYFILTSADDLERWAHALDDSKTDIAKAVVRLSAKVRLMPGKDNHFVFGQSKRNINGQTVFFHEGVNEYIYLTRIPAKDLSVITFGNHSEGFGSENKAIVDHLLGVAEKPKPQFRAQAISIPARDLEKYVGKFVWLDQVSWESYSIERKTSEFFIEDGVLKCRYRAGYVISLVPVGKDLFYYNEGFGVQVEFIRSAVDGKLEAEVRFDDGFPSTRMQKDTSEIWQPTNEELARLTGKFYSTHLDFYWTIAVNEEGKLVIKRPSIPDTVIEPDGRDQFHLKLEKYPGISSSAWVRFHQDKEGRVTHLTVWHPRLMNHRFDKV